MPEQITLINERIGCHALPFAKIFEGVIGVQGICPDLEFLSITGRMQGFLIFTVDIGQFHPIHKPNNTIIGRADVIKRKIPVDGMLQSALINQF